jgi:hypothetical protein
MAPPAFAICSGGAGPSHQARVSPRDGHAARSLLHGGCLHPRVALGIERQRCPLGVCHQSHSTPFVRHAAVWDRPRRPAVCPRRGTERRQLGPSRDARHAQTAGKTHRNSTRALIADPSSPTHIPGDEANSPTVRATSLSPAAMMFSALRSRYSLPRRHRFVPNPRRVAMRGGRFDE